MLGCTLSYSLMTRQPAQESILDGTASPPKTRASATVSLANNAGKFREFAMTISDNIRIAVGGGAPVGDTAVNYRSEPWQFRYTGNSTTDYSCMLSNQLIGADPQ